MTEQLTVGSVMTSYPYFIDSHSSLKSAKTMLDQYNVNHLPVKDGNKPIGVISRAGLERVRQESISSDIDAEVNIGDVCDRAILIVTRDKNLKELLQEIAEKHVECVLIDSSQGLEGIYTVSDACMGYANLLD